MLFVDFFQWWYGAGWLSTVAKTQYHLSDLAKNYSIAILLKTLFAPWKQLDAFPGVNQSLDDRMRRELDKFVSRFVGFMVRSITLFAAFISLIALLIARLIWIILWPCLPLVAPVAVLYALGVVL